MDRKRPIERCLPSASGTLSQYTYHIFNNI